MSGALNNDSITTETLQAYQALCAFCSWALYADPAEETMRGMVQDRAMFSEAPFTQVASDASRALVELFDGAAQSPEAFADFMHQVHLDRTYLFLAQCVFLWVRPTPPRPPSPASSVCSSRIS